MKLEFPIKSERERDVIDKEINWVIGQTKMVKKNTKSL